MRKVMLKAASLRAAAALVALSALVALPALAALSVLASPAAASERAPAWPGFPVLPSPHLRDGNNTTDGTDTVSPALEITSHRDRETVKEAGITLRGTASDAGGVRSVDVSLNGGAYVTAYGNLSWSLPIRLEEGRNTISVRATDMSGNPADLNISVVLSTTVRDNTGLLLSAAVIIPVVALIVLFIMRRRAPLAGEKPGEPEGIEKRLAMDSKKPDETGAEPGDSEGVTRLEEAPIRKKARKPGR